MCFIILLSSSSSVFFFFCLLLLLSALRGFCIPMEFMEAWMVLSDKEVYGEGKEAVYNGFTSVHWVR
jgi:hypothetical protein